MSKNMLTITTVICIAALAVCGAWILGRTVFDGMRYPDAERYTAGGTTLNDDVKSLEIDWTDGSVTIARHAGNTVEVSETAPGAISADAALRWWLDGDTLRIQFAKSGFFTFRSLNKALTVTLPEGLELENVDIDVTSGDVNAPDLRADDIRVDLTSGDLALSQSGSTQSMALSSTSGDISVSAGEVGSLSVSGTSANMRIAAERTEALKASITSGTIFVEGGEAGKVDVNTTSGAVDVSLAPLLMKKGRPGHLLLALCAPERADEVAAAILRETTTLGVRRRDMARYEMDRCFVEKDVAGGVVRVKRAAGYGAAKEKPEHDDAVRAAAWN